MLRRRIQRVRELFASKRGALTDAKAEACLLNIWNRRPIYQERYPEVAQGNLIGLAEEVAGLLEFPTNPDPHLSTLKLYLPYYKKLIDVGRPSMASGMTHTLAKHEIKTDISDHLPTLFIMTKELKLRRILELGVRFGNSTVALLEAALQIDGHVWSVDVAPCPQARKLVHECELDPYWTFIQGNDLDIEWAQPIDHLFIDTDHVYPQTMAELKRFEPLVSQGGLITLHDSVSFPGVARAVRDYFQGRSNISLYEYRNSYGLILIRKKGG